MRPILLVASCVAVFASACLRPPVAAEPKPAPSSTKAAVVEEDCTLETPLVPGVPGSPGNLIASEINPNGASELATLMRVMQKDLGNARDAIARGERPAPLFAKHRKLRCAWPTDPTERNETFDAMAQAYLVQLKAFDEAQTDLAAAHDTVITGCVACHQTSCTGPIPAIEALRSAP